jgi:hypothetical protein
MEGNGADMATPIIDASPTKRFFVRMLVRDIELVPAIMDLIDNSVDGAKRLALERAKGKEQADDPKAHPGTVVDLSSHKVELGLSADKFSIVDDCGGIELAVAIRSAFRFGRPDGEDGFEGEVGQFGVGMKRALFKLGEKFVIASTAPTSRFLLEVDVQQWLATENDWSLPIEESQSGMDNDDAGLGTDIEVTNLLPSVSAEFHGEEFAQRLRSQIEFRHQPAIAAGLTIKLNGNPLQDKPIKLLSTDGLQPRVENLHIETEDGTVQMKLYAGFVDLGDDGKDTDDPDDFPGGNLAGWYVICNDRMLVFADRTRLTGWGAEVAEYHPQYRLFRGYVYLTGSSSAMPWNTAKTTVDEDSAVWREVRKQIVNALREARTVMNRIKVEVSELPSADRPISSQLSVAKEVDLSDLPDSPKLVVPPKPPKAPPTSKGISYKVPPDLFQEVADSLGADTAVEVGRQTFDYYYEREMDG